MEVENTKNGWEFTSRDQALFTKPLHHTVPTRTASQKGQIERLWRESRLLLQRQSSTNDSGWKSQIQSSISKIAAQQVQLQLHPTSSGTASNRTCHTSKLSVQQPMFMFQRKNGSNWTPTHTKGS